MLEMTVDKEEKRNFLNMTTKVGWALITPEMAKKFLERNTDNYRKIDNRVVEKYADDMKNDRWETNAEPITFNDKNILLNGQHRLNAIILSGKPQLMMVVKGLPDTKIFDVNKVRSDVDILKAQGLEHVSNTVISTAKLFVLGYDESKKKIITNGRTEVHDFVKKHYDLLDRARKIANTGKDRGRRLGGSNVVAAVVTVIVLSLCNDEKLKEFFSAASTGFPPEGWRFCPAIVFRNFMLSNTSRTNHNPVVFENAYKAIIDFAFNKDRKQIYKYDGKSMSAFEMARSLLGVFK